MNRQKVSDISWCCLNFSSKTNALGKSHFFSTHPSLPSSTKSTKSWFFGYSVDSRDLNSSTGGVFRPSTLRVGQVGQRPVRDDKWSANDGMTSSTQQPFFFKKRFPLKKKKKDFRVHVKLTASPKNYLVSLLFGSHQVHAPKTTN